MSQKSKETEAIALLDGVIHNYMCRVCGKYSGDSNSPSKHWTDCPVDQALTKLREAPKSTPECRADCDVYKDWLKLEARNVELQSDIDKLREAIKEVIAILEKEKYLYLGEYTMAPGVKDAIAKLRLITAPEPKNKEK